MTFQEVLYPGPSEYLVGSNVVADLGRVVARFGRRTLLVHGEHGYPQVRETLHASLISAEVSWLEALHSGPSSPTACARLHEFTDNCSSVVAVGGGRVVDVGKTLAYEIGVPCVTLPTSPATCAAATPVVVLYQPDGTYERSLVLNGLHLVSVIDTGVISGAPDRLLSAGLADALAKAVEVRFATGRDREHTIHRATALAALALCDRLEEVIERDGRAALVAGPGFSLERSRVAEVSILYPALIGGLAGEGAKLAAAHAVHNALTAFPVSHRALHGELVAFGVLVQKALEGLKGVDLQEWAIRFNALGCPCDLKSLGCTELLRTVDRIAERTASMPSMRSAFPGITVDEIEEAFVRAHRAAVAAALA